MRPLSNNVKNKNILHSVKIDYNSRLRVRISTLITLINEGDVTKVAAIAHFVCNTSLVRLQVVRAVHPPFEFIY